MPILGLVRSSKELSEILFGLILKGKRIKKKMKRLLFIASMEEGPKFLQFRNRIILREKEINI